MQNLKVLSDEQQVSLAAVSLRTVRHSVTPRSGNTTLLHIYYTTTYLQYYIITTLSRY